jgi:uncharacterized protein DUF1254
MMPIEYKHLLIFGTICVATWLLVTYLLPRLMLSIYKRAALSQGFGDGPIPVNTLYTQPQKLLADPFTPLPPGSSKLMSVGTNRDTLYVVGWLDLSKKPLVLSVPEMAGRYYRCSSPTRRGTSTSPTLANAPPARKRATTSSAVPAGKEPRRKE